MRQIPRPPRPPRPPKVYPPKPRSIASVALEAWLDEDPETRSQTMLREQLERFGLFLERQTISAYVIGIRVPKLDAAAAIEKITGGVVIVDEWRDPAPAGGAGGGGPVHERVRAASAASRAIRARNKRARKRGGTPKGGGSVRSDRRRAG